MSKSCSSFLDLIADLLSKYKATEQGFIKA